tara:strand:- start:299 stop:475 length:177 start_codon:yes stop_codon:yes gene_type:complete
MVRHFKTRLQAKKYKAEQIKKRVWGAQTLTIRKKVKGQLNRKAKPFTVSTYLEWVNLY